MTDGPSSRKTPPVEGDKVDVTVADVVAALTELTNQLRNTLPDMHDLEQLADVAGRLRWVETEVQAKRWAISEDVLAEAGGAAVQGSSYVVAPGGRTERSFHTTGLLAHIAGATGLAPADALLYAVAQGLVKLSWQWTPLSKWWQREHGEQLVEMRGEVADDGDLDTPADQLVGKRWAPGRPTVTASETPEEAQ